MRTFIFCLLMLCTGFARAQTTASFTVDVSASNNYQLIKVLQLSAGKLGVLLATPSNANLYYQVFDGATRTVNVELTSRIAWPNTNHASTEINAVAAMNDNVFITYNSSDGGATMVTTAMSYLVVNASGALVTSGQVNTTNPGTVQTRFARLINLSNNKVLILFSRSDNASYAFRIFNMDGSASTPADNVFATAASLGGSVYTTQVAASNAGRFMATTYYYNGKLKGYLFNNDGTSVPVGGVSPFDVDPTVTSEYTNQAIIGLSNGNFALFWITRAPPSYAYNYNYKVLSSAGASVTNITTNTLGSAMVDVFPENQAGSPGYYIAQAVAQNPNDNLNPNSKVVLNKFNLSNVLQSTTELDGYMISPSYDFVPGNGGGYGYMYSYYRSYAVDNSCPGYEYAYATGDADIKGKMQSLSTFTTLPVSLVAFTAHTSGGQVLLQWKTATEQNSKAFVVQRSNDLTNWTTLGLVSAAGNSQQARTYQFTDPQPGTRNYYRLVQTDLDDKEHFSSVELVMIGRPAMFRVYPNPARDYAIVELPGQGEAQIKLYGSDGQLVRRQTASSNTVKLELASLPSGLYRVEVQQNGHQYAQKIMVK